MMTSWRKSVLARGGGRGSSCCESTLVLVVDVVKLRSRRNKALEGLMNLVRFIKVVCVLLVCHDHSMLGRFEKRAGLKVITKNKAGEGAALLFWRDNEGCAARGVPVVAAVFRLQLNDAQEVVKKTRRLCGEGGAGRCGRWCSHA